MKFAWVQLYPNKHTLDIAKEIEEVYNCEVTYYFFRGLLPERLRQGWVIPRLCKMIPKKFGREYLSSLRRIIKSDVCVIFGAVAPFPWMFIIFVLTVNLRKRVFFISEGIRYKQSLLRCLVSRFLINRKSVCYLAVGNGAANDYKALGMSKWTYRRFAFAEKYSKVKPFSRPATEPLVVLAVGQLIPRKNFSQIIEAFRHYRDAKNISIRIAGSGVMLDALKNLALQELPSKVELKLLGNCDQSTLDYEFRNADIFVIPSVYDGWGVVVNQALAYGLPIIASEGTRSARDNLVCHGENGFIFNDARSLRKSLKLLLNNDELRSSMSKSSFERAELWSVREIALRTFSVINDESIDFKKGLLKKL